MSLLRHSLATLTCIQNTFNEQTNEVKSLNLKFNLSADNLQSKQHN